MQKFLSTFAHTSSQRDIFAKIVEDEPYFKAIATMNTSEIDSCLEKINKDYEDCPRGQGIRNRYNLRYEIGLIIACYMTQDANVLNKIILPTLHKYYQSQTGISTLDLLSYNKHFESTDLVIKDMIAKHFDNVLNNLYSEYKVPALFKKDNFGEMRCYLITIMQTYYHLKHEYVSKFNFSI